MSFVLFRYVTDDFHEIIPDSRFTARDRYKGIPGKLIDDPFDFVQSQDIRLHDAGPLQVLRTDNHAKLASQIAVMRDDDRHPQRWQSTALRVEFLRNGGISLRQIPIEVSKMQMAPVSAVNTLAQYYNSMRSYCNFRAWIMSAYP